MKAGRQAVFPFFRLKAVLQTLPPPVFSCLPAFLITIPRSARGQVGEEAVHFGVGADGDAEPVGDAGEIEVADVDTAGAEMLEDGGGVPAGAADEEEIGGGVEDLVSPALQDVGDAGAGGEDLVEIGAEGGVVAQGGEAGGLGEAVDVVAVLDGV